MSEPSSKNDKIVSKWLPISLITVTTVALFFPAALLWRQRAKTLHSVLENGPPIRNSISASSSHVKVVPSESTAPPPRRAANISIRPPQRPIVSQNQASQISKASTADAFDNPLYSLGALGLATMAVGVVAGASVWGVKNTLGVKNVDEFAAYMRYIILTRMPSIASKLYGGQEETSDSRKDYDGKDEEMWTWAAAEGRLTEAYEQGGFTAWLQRAMTELEAENKVERTKRGLQ